jgi:hypothetical protein
MPKFLRNLYLTRISFGLAAVLLLCAANSLAQGPETPVVYTVENTGANYPPPVIPPYPNLPIIRPLPDPFVFFNGTRDTTFGAFEQHRNEWMYAIEQNEIGPKPSCSNGACIITASYVPTSSTRGTLTINVTVNGNTLTFTAAVVLPAATGGPFPYVIGIGGATGSMPASMFAGVATVVYSLNSITTYSAGQLRAHNTDPFYKLYPQLCAGVCNSTNGFPNGSNSGQYAAWTWGVSRLIDGIQIASQQTTNPLPLDTTHSAITGCSYAGKMALWSGALDERIALTIAQENGGGGAPSWRVSHEIETQGSVENINDTDYSWFGTQMKQFAGANIYKMPTDHHELMAMVAPRALVQTGDSLYYWLGDRSATIDSLATEKIYSTYGIGDRFGYYIDTNHNHCVVPAYQQAAMQPFINRFLLGQNVSTNLAVSWQLADALQGGSQPTIDPNMWTAWWGTNTPAFPANDVWNNGGDVALPLNQNLTVNTGDTVQTSFALSMPGNHAAATVTYPIGYTETDVSCSDGTSYTLTIPLANQVFSIPANDNSSYPSTVGSATNPGCANGGPGQTTGNYFFALGLPNPGAGNPGLTGFSTTNGTQATAQTDPLAVTFNLSDSSTGQGGGFAPWTTLNRANPYSCTPPGCPLNPTLTWPTPGSITYGTPLGPSQLNAAASSTLISGLQGSGSTGLLTTASLPGTFAYTPDVGAVLSAGPQTLSAVFTPTALGTKYNNYTIATTAVPLIVNPAPLTVTTNNATMPVGGPMPAFTASYSGFVNGDTASALSGAPSFSTTATSSSPTGTYPITVTQHSLSAANYSFAFVSGTLSVVAPPIVVITTTATIAGSASAGYVATITVTNSGTGPASNVALTSATLGSATGSPLPQTKASITAGGSVTYTVSFPGSAGKDGAGVAEKYSGTYTGGSFSASVRSVTLP